MAGYTVQMAHIWSTVRERRMDGGRGGVGKEVEEGEKEVSRAAREKNQCYMALEIRRRGQGRSNGRLQQDAYQHQGAVH